MSFNRFKGQNGHQAKGGISRRGFLTRVGIAAAGTLLIPSADVFANALGRERRITLFNTHTKEEWGFVCSPQQDYDPALLDSLNHFLRDHYADVSHTMDPALLDLLYAVTVLTGGRGEYNILSGYVRRKPTNGYAKLVMASLNIVCIFKARRLTCAPRISPREPSNKLPSLCS